MFYLETRSASTEIRGALARMYKMVGVRDGHLWPCRGDRSSVAPNDLYSVQVLWQGLAPPPWIGWVTTTSRRAVRFSATDLTDRAFRTWLADLPCWEAARLALAIEVAGLHLVWRSPAL